MSREWNPGDVALRTFDGDATVSVVVECKQHSADGPHWHHADGGWDLLRYSYCPIQSMSTYRPLVVIDPEDTEVVERLVTAWLEQANRIHAHGPRMQAALREFANPTPPKPDEPMGLGAVVEDAEGVRYVRTVTASQDDGHLGKPWVEGVVRRNWQIVPAVRILSEGVTP